MKQEELLQWVADIFEEPRQNISINSVRDEIAGWDSLGVLTLMAGLDEKFDIRLKASEVSDLQSVGDIVSVIERHKVLAD
jgi:acyl carrier protein